MQKQFIDAILSTNIVSKTDINGVITFVNDEFCELCGYSKEELIGQKHSIIKHPDNPKESFEPLWQNILAKKIHKSTVKNLSKDGRVFFVNTTIIPILDEKEDIVEFIAIRYDVTNEMLLQEKLINKELELAELNKNLEKKIKEQTKELHNLNRSLEKRVALEIEKNEQRQLVMFWQSRHASLGQMLANIAHQWRQPLMEMSLLLFGLKKATNAQNSIEFDRYYGDATNILQHMSSTIEDFSNFFKPQKQKVRFNVASSIDEALNILENSIKESMINIKYNRVDIEILGVLNELTQVIINLINNSKDAFLKNGILFREITIDIKKDSSNVLIELSDNAGGIAEDILEAIFEPYFTTKHKSRGTGLGLFMSKMICEQGFGGSLNVRSKNSSSTFCIKLPIL